MPIASRILTGLIVVVGAAGLFVLLAWLFQRWMIYLPLDHHVPQAGSVLPGSRELTIETEDGVPLGAWFVPASGQRVRGTVLLFNGNAGNRSHRAPLARALSEVGLSALLLDYRGYGGNPGRPTEPGLERDALAAREALVRLDGVDANRIIYFGESLGTAVAISLATRHPPAAMILRSPFTSMVDVGRVHFFFLPVRTLLKDRYPSIDRVGSIGCPLLVIAGEKDGIVPAEQSLRIFDAAAEPKRLFILPGADHNDPELIEGPEVIEEIARFLGEVAALRP